MYLMGGGLFLAFLWVADPVSLGGEVSLLGEGPTLREPQPPEEEEEMVGPRSPRVEEPLELANHEVLANHEDLQDHSPLCKGFQEKGVKPFGFWPAAGFMAWSQGLHNEPVCQVKLARPTPLVVVGLLNSYDRAFLKALSRLAWDTEASEMFGMCPRNFSRGLLLSLRRVGESLAGPAENGFLLLHLEEVKWEEASTKLRFRLAFHEDVVKSLSFPSVALLVFYQGEKEVPATAAPWQKFLVGGEGVHQTQVVCLSRRTRYLVLQASVIPGRRTPGQISMDFSLEIKQHGSRAPFQGVALSPRESQDLLFGFDAKRFTRMTPSVFLLAQQMAGEAGPPLSSFLAAGGKVDVVPYLKPSSLPAFGEAEAASSPDDTVSVRTNTSAPLPMSTERFLEGLSQFIHRVLSPPLASRPALRLDVDTLDSLPHLLLNLSEEEALEQLVRSEDHFVVLFPEESQALMERHLAHWSLEGPLLGQLLAKLRAVIKELEASPSFQAHGDLFRALLAFCYYPPGAPTNPPGAREKFHSLLLLKSLQVVRARWQEARKVSARAHRSTGHHEDYCRLRELKIDLTSNEYIFMPDSYNANNCAGPCRRPLSTRVSDYYTHTVFLLHMQEQGLPLSRAPCCIPVKYSGTVLVMFTKDQGAKVKVYKDMVAESCGCR